MPVVTVPVTLSVPKEGKEVVDAVTGLLKHFVNGGSFEGAMALLPAVVSAVEGFQVVGEEIKSQFKDELSAYLVQKVWSAVDKSAQ